jgi:fibronectin-binding autotransporter adhesin
VSFRRSTKSGLLRTIGIALFFTNAKLEASTFYWDGGVASLSTAGDGQSAGGIGSWNTTLSNWDNGTIHRAWPTSGSDNDAHFAGTGGAISLTSAITANELNFYSNGYSIAGSTSGRITLNGSSAGVYVAANVTTTISAGISGTVGLIKSGSGTLSLTNSFPATLNNTYSNGTFINEGTLAVVADLNFGTVPVPAATNITINGGTLQINTGFNLNINRRIVLGTNNATLAMNSTGEFRAQSIISGFGSLTLTGSGLSGAYVPTAANTYSGGTYLGAGVISTPNLSTAGTAGAPSSGPYGTGTLFFAGGSLLGGAVAATIGNTVSVTADTTFIAGGLTALTFSGPVFLQGNRTFTLQNSESLVFSGVIGNGAGVSGLTLGAQSRNDSSIVLTANNSYTGPTKIQGGILRLSGTDGSLSASNSLEISSGTLISGDSLTTNNASKSNRIHASLDLQLGGAAGGTYTIVGGGTGPAAHQQHFASLSLGRGTNALNSSSTSVSSEAILVIDGSTNFQRTAGGILNYTSAAGFNPSFASLPTGNGVSGGVLAGAIRNGTDFIDANSLVLAAANSTPDVWSANTQTTITASNSSPFSGITGSLRFNNPGSAVLTLSGTNVIQSGNILVTENVGGANGTTISGGTLTSGNSSDLIAVQNNGAATTSTATSYPAALSISSSLVDHGGNSIGFTKAGTGVVILNGSSANTYTGTTTVLGSGSLTNYAPLILAKPAGVNAISGNLSIGSTGYAAVYLAASNQIADHAVLDFQGIRGTQVHYAFWQLRGFAETIAGLNDPLGVGVVEIEEQDVINASSTLTLSGSGSYAFNGALRNRAGTAGSGVLNLVINGTGVQTLSGANISYTGATTIQSGTLNLVDTPSFASSLTLGSANSMLQISSGISITGLQTVDGSINSNAIVQNVAGVSAVLTVNQSSDAVFGGILRDNPNQTVPSSFGLLKSGTGSLTLANTNAFTGPITLNEGSLVVGSDGALGNGSLLFNNAGGVIRALDANSKTANNAILLATNSTFGSTTTGNLLFTGAVDFGGFNKTISIQNQQTEFGGVVSSIGTGMLTKLGAGNLVMSAPNTYTGATVVAEGALTLTGNRTANAGGITVGNSSTQATLNIANGNFTVTGDFVVGLGNTNGLAIVNQTGGTITLSSSSTQLVLGRINGYSSGVYNLTAGTIVGQSSAFNGITLGSNTDNQGTFLLSGTGIVSMPDAMLQVGRSEAPAERTSGTFTQTGGVATFGKLSIGGGAGANNKNTTGVLTITGGSFSASTFTSLAGGDASSATIYIGGTAEVTLPAFPTARGAGSTAILTFDGGSLLPAHTSTNYLAGLDHAYLTANGATFIVAVDKAITIAQNLENAPTEQGRLMKSGSGDLTLSGNNTYTGVTTIAAGRLIVDGSILSSVDVLAQGILGGSGSIVGDVTGNGTISPGNSIGVLSVEGHYQPTGLQVFELAKDALSGLANDQIMVNGAITYAGTLKVMIPENQQLLLTVGDRWQLYAVTGASTGSFNNDWLFGTSGNGLDLPMLNEGVWDFDYETGSLFISAIPEPATWGLALIVSLGTLFVRTNKRHKC